MYSSSVINPDEQINDEEDEFDISDREDDSEQEDEPCVQSFAPQDEESQRKTNQLLKHEEKPINLKADSL